MRTMSREQIEELVEEFGIDKKTNRRTVVYKRFYMCYYLRRKAQVKTLQEVADYVGYRKHDNVVYAIKQHDTLRNDSFYKAVTAELRRAIECIEQDIEREEPTIEERVLMCENYWQMKQLQELIQEKSVTK